ncbi:MAG TPA: YhjD/YihY/BrkB family envelope integrity protein [Micromonosporaceae bacterium]
MVEGLRGAGRLWRRVRRRYGWVDHAGRAVDRLVDQHAERLAAALAYYAFFAAFALSGLGFAVLGWMLRTNSPASLEAQRWVDHNLPWIDVPALVEASARLGVIALVALVVAGLAWIRGLRSAVRTVWRLEAAPGRFPVRLAFELAVLVGFCLLLLVSVGTAVVVSAVVRWLVVDAAGAGGWPALLLFPTLGLLFGLVVNALLAMVLLSVLPRIRMPVRRLLGPALLVAVGLELLKTVGRLFLERSAANPAYQAVASAAGLLLFLYLLNQVVLFAAALTATSGHGEATDLAQATRRDRWRRGPPVGHSAAGMDQHQRQRGQPDRAVLGRSEQFPVDDQRQ